MSKMLKIVLAAAVLLIIIAGLYFWFWKTYVQHTSPEVQVPTQTQSSDTLPSGTSTTDTSLNQDLNAIDAQMGTFTNDKASIDASVSDTAVQQSSL